MTARACTHFVGFRDDRFWQAVKVWGRPDFIHPTWDRRALTEIMPGDTVVFAKGDERSPVKEISWNDSERM